MFQQNFPASVVRKPIAVASSRQYNILFITAFSFGCRYVSVVLKSEPTLYENMASVDIITQNAINKSVKILFIFTPYIYKYKRISCVDVILIQSKLPIVDFLSRIHISFQWKIIKQVRKRDNRPGTNLCLPAPTINIIWFNRNLNRYAAYLE